MNLLKAILYDPSGAVSKATSSLIAMTAFDTTNLRLAVTVPAHGMVRIHMHCVLEGATTFPSILLGVLNGASVIGRVAPVQTLGNTAVATARLSCDADFTMTGLAPGAMNMDAAYGVEVVVAATNIKYGGPNDTTTDNAWGGFVFEAFDPQPITPAVQLLVDANGRVDVIKIAGTTQTARDLGASVLLSTGTGTGQLDFTSGIVKANATQILGTAVSTPATAGILDVNVKNMNNVSGSAITTVKAVQGLTTADTIATYTGNTVQTGDSFAIVKSGGTGDNAAIKAKTDNLPAAPASTTNITAGTITTVTNLTNAPTAGDLTAAMKTSVTTAATAATPTAAAVTGAVGSVTAAVSITGDLSATMKTSVTTAATAATPTAAAVTGAVGSVTGNVGGSVASVVGAVGSVTGLAAANLDIAVSSRLAAASYTAPNNSDITSIKTQTDKLAFTKPNQIDANIISIKSTTLTGDGSDAAPWNP